MRIAICEDTDTDREMLIRLCRQYTEQRSVLLEPIVYESTTELLADNRVMDIGALILDIHMENALSGVETARILRKRGYSGALVFATVSQDFYADGFQVGALHYLLKPVSYEDFEEAMSRVARTIGVFEQYITVMSLRKQAQIPLRHILYAEVEKHHTTLYTSAGSVTINSSLTKTEQMLSGPQFLKCYRSCIVNMDKIAQVEENDFLLKNGMRVPISKRQSGIIKDRYMRYIFGAKDT